MSDPYAISSSPELEGTSIEPSYPSYEQGKGEAENFEAQHTDSTEAHAHGLEALSAAALYMPSQDAPLQESIPYQVDGFEDMDVAPMDEGAFTSTASPQTQTLLLSSSRDLDLILNPASSLPATIDPSLQPIESCQGVPDTSRAYNTARGPHLKASTETNRTIAFLVRHFSEVTGRWYVHRSLHESCTPLCE